MNPPAWLASSKVTTVEPARAAMSRCWAGSMIRSCPETAYQEGMFAHAGGPEGVNRIPRFAGCWAAASLAASLGLRSWAKSARKKAGSMMAEPW